MLPDEVDEEIVWWGRIPPLDNSLVGVCLACSARAAGDFFCTIVLIALCLAPKLNFEDDSMSSTLILTALAKLLLFPLLLVFLLSVLNAGLAGKVERLTPPLLDLLDE
jgi:hypothetical protein